jgi:phage-related protein
VESSKRARRRWRDYRTPSGGRPIREFFEVLTRDEAIEVAAAMNDVARNGLEAARHLRGEIYEVRAEATTRSFRLLFALETKFILLGLSAFQKKTQKTPKQEIELAEERLKSWRERGKRRRK